MECSPCAKYITVLEKHFVCIILWKLVADDGYYYFHLNEKIWARGNSSVAEYLDRMVRP